MVKKEDIKFPLYACRVEGDILPDKLSELFVDECNLYHIYIFDAEGKCVHIEECHDDGQNYYTIAYHNMLCGYGFIDGGEPPQVVQDAMEAVRGY